MTLLIIDMDFRYQFNMGLIAPLFTVSYHEKFGKKMFYTIFKSWQVCDVAEGFSAFQRRSCW